MLACRSQERHVTEVNDMFERFSRVQQSYGNPTTLQHRRTPCLTGHVSRRDREHLGSILLVTATLLRGISGRADLRNGQRFSETLFQVSEGGNSNSSNSRTCSLLSESISAARLDAEYRTSLSNCKATPPSRPSIRFLIVRTDVRLGLPPDPATRRRPCAMRGTQRTARPMLGAGRKSSARPGG